MPTFTAAPWVESVNVTWASDAHDLDRVEVHASATPGFTPNASTLRKTFDVEGDPVPDTRGSVEGLSGDRTWHVKAVAVDTKGASNASAELAVRPYPDRAPAPPGTPDVTRQGALVRVAWTPSPEESLAHYRVLVREREGALVADRTVPPQGPHSVDLTDLPAEENLSVVVGAVGFAGKVGESAPVHFTSPPGNRRPVAIVTPAEAVVRAGAPLTLDSNGSADPDGDALTFTWHWGDGAAPSAGPRATHTYAHPGVYGARLVAKDPRGLTHEASVRVTVTQDANQPPVARLAISRGLLAVGGRVEVDAAGTLDPDGDALNVTLDWGDGTPPLRGPPGNASHAYARAGQYVILLTARDEGGATATAKHHVRVEADAPPLAQLTLSRATLHEGEPLVADASGSRDPGGRGGLYYRFDWGDGASSEGEARVKHVYARPGVYAVRLTVTDAHGQVDWRSMDVTVSAAPPPSSPSPVEAAPTQAQPTQARPAQAQPTPEKEDAARTQDAGGNGTEDGGRAAAPARGPSGPPVVVPGPSMLVAALGVALAALARAGRRHR